MQKNIFGSDIPYYIFETEKLAGNGLYYGGEVDDNGNIFREKDVLENDFSEPLLQAGTYYVSSLLFVSYPNTNKKKLSSSHYYRVNGLSPKFQLKLSEEEYKQAVREPSDGEYVELIARVLHSIGLADDVYRYLKKEFVLQDVTDYIVENNYDNEFPDNDEEIKKIGKMADEVATRYIYWGKNDANLSYWENIKTIFDGLLLEDNNPNG